ncbi:MAG TPA: hypothetical protein VHD90_20325 [Phototrophicaceae bacterium]|nr:hypothetical protein [Phototrophicaceae bacterium]
MKTKLQNPRSVTESGVFEKPDPAMFTPHEPAEPHDKPEVIEHASSTSVMMILTEGEDAAKLKDDSAAGRKQ